MGGSITGFLLILISISSLTTISFAQTFKCSSPAKCNALVGYISPNTTTLSSIQSLFNVKNLRSILAANNLSLSTPRTYSIPSQQTVKIPIPCVCTNDTGVSYNMPVYTVKKDDGLFHIAADVFSGLVVYQRIQEVNNITDPNLIEIGQNLTIPLPCSCDEVNGERVVHYAHVVAPGSSFDSIAQQFGVGKELLMKLNGIDSEKKLIADRPLDVPLKACNSSIRSDSLDNSLVVANGTYVFTANNCVKCKCDSANNWTLQCEPSQLKSSNWETCPSMQCEGANSLSIGNMTSDACDHTACTYAGYSNQTIFSTLVNTTTCSTPGTGNNASRIGLSWNALLISIHLVLLYLHLFR